MLLVFIILMSKKQKYFPWVKVRKLQDNIVFLK